MLSIRLILIKPCSCLKLFTEKDSPCKSYKIFSSQKIWENPEVIVLRVKKNIFVILVPSSADWLLDDDFASESVEDNIVQIMVCNTNKNTDRT